MRIVRRALPLAVAAFTLAACGGGSSDAADSAGASAGEAPATVRTPDGWPLVGLAIADSGTRWCATLPTDSLEPGTVVSIVFPDSASPVARYGARVVGRRSAPCETAFPQPEVDGHTAFDLEAAVPGDRAAEDVALVAIAVTGDTEWRRGPDGVVRADLNGDGSMEDARICAAGEGQHLTIWRPLPTVGGRERWWHGYFDWGALVEETCSPAESQGELTSAPPGASAGSDRTAGA